MDINRATTIHCAVDMTPVAYALEGLCNDLTEILGHTPEMSSAEQPNQIRIRLGEGLHEEGFRVLHRAGSDHLAIEGADDLGVVFGIYHVCEHILGVDPFQYWTELPYPRRDAVQVPELAYESPRPKVRFRGFFVNDQDCLSAWEPTFGISVPLYRKIYETALRAGYNMVVASSGPDSGEAELVADLGMWYTHTHVSGLGARPFFMAYPGQEPRLPDDKDKYIPLYREAIERNRGRKMVWSLAFRGHGDHPFFRRDYLGGDVEEYATAEVQGRIISEMLRLQKELVLEMTDGPQHFCHNLYQESAELYKQGYLELDDDVIRVWGDNGFGGMRRRRTLWEPELHVEALPGPEDRDRSNGVYYHLSFHDALISSKLTPLVNPDLIVDEFQKLYNAGNIDYLTLNVSNIHPHVMGIDLVGKVTSLPADEELPDDMADRHYRAWTGKYFPGFEEEVTDLLKRYFDAPFRVGPYPDDLAGEQVYHFGMRSGINAELTGADVAPRYIYVPEIADGTISDNEGCYRWHLEKARESLERWEPLLRDVRALRLRMEGHAARYLEDTLLLHTGYLTHCCQGFVEGLEGLLDYRAGEFRDAFAHFHRAVERYREAWEALLAMERGKWLHFFRGETVTNTRWTIQELETIRGVSRIRGEDYWRRTWWPQAAGQRRRWFIPGWLNDERMGWALAREGTPYGVDPLDLLR